MPLNELGIHRIFSPAVYFFFSYVVVTREDSLSDHEGEGGNTVRRRERAGTRTKILRERETRKETGCFARVKSDEKLKAPALHALFTACVVTQPWSVAGHKSTRIPSFVTHSLQQRERNISYVALFTQSSVGLSREPRYTSVRRKKNYFRTKDE